MRITEFHLFVFRAYKLKFTPKSHPVNNDLKNIFPDSVCVCVFQTKLERQIRTKFETRNRRFPFQWVSSIKLKFLFFSNKVVSLSFRLRR